ncbi:hypothetical protein FJZ19_02515 [Candidatus Pacearchaeota archaeon]|nr:hypothetical protein [Candidatus Pacearchaeota archaeon]
MHTKYKIHKLRFGNHGQWRSWEYEAVSVNADYTQIKNSDRGVTKPHTSIDELAREMTTFPGIDDAEFIPGFRAAGPRVSLGKGGSKPMTQEAVISDEELGELGRLVQHYLRDEEIKSEKK